MNPDDNALFDRAAYLLKALANPIRMQIILLIASRSLTVTELQTQLNKSQPTVSQHLGKMRALGLVAAKTEGKTVLYSLADPTFAQLTNTLLNSPLLRNLTPPQDSPDA